MVKRSNFEVINREISWLSFNDRVLQEAADPSVPIIERLRFLGIFSNNQDEFFRVRVATLKRLEDLGSDAEDYLDMDPRKCLSEIQATVIRLQAKFEKVYQTIIQELEEIGIHMLDETELDDEQQAFVRSYFDRVVRPNLVPIMLTKGARFPEIRDKSIYLAIKLSNVNQLRPDYAVVELPTKAVGRFLVLPEKNGRKHVMILDDIVRYNLPEVFHIFHYDKIEAFTFKITRDAELDIEEDVSKSFMEKLEESVANRKKGQFTRFVYDASVPDDLFAYLVKKLKLKETRNLIPGGRYHNFKDFMDFPAIEEETCMYETLPALQCPDLPPHHSVLEKIAEQDILLTYPFQSFNHIIDLLREAAMDPDVLSIRINIYRVAKNSKVINALINAARNGKQVEVVLELQARFDEENNLYWSSKLQEEGCHVAFGVDGLKVHSKLILIERKEGDDIRFYAHIGTGNFHEGNARIYTDYSLLTADQRIGKEVSRVFQFLRSNYLHFDYKHLLVSPYTTRSTYVRLIKREIAIAKAGKPAYIHIKLNNLVDRDMIYWLYTASEAGVKIRCVIRGICSLIPGVEGMSSNIEVISIVDRFLEHTRCIIFGNNGDEELYISSADWMSRNLDRRVEVSVPIRDKKIKKILRRMMDIWFSDNTKARIIDRNLYNLYVSDEGRPKVRSQYAIYDFFKAELATVAAAEDELKKEAG